VFPGIGREKASFQGRYMRDTSELIALGQSLFREEVEELAACSDEIGESFAEAARRICDLPPTGRLLVSGIGKAGYIAMKVSASLASTGIQSFYVHPAEALHGDLGRFGNTDFVLIFSNSGETEELLCLLPSLRTIGCTICSVTSTTTSTLAKKSDLVLPLGKLREIGQNKLAPTTSAAAMLVLGDALTMTITEMRGCTQHDFARSHPGGNLGRALMPVSEIMRAGEYHCLVEQNTPCKEVLHKYTTTPGRPGCATIIDTEGRMLGIFTDGNLRRCLDSGLDFLSQPIANFMTLNPKSLARTALAREALELLSAYQIDQVVIIDEENRPVGLVDIQDVARIFTNTGM
jgi:arabinose-5-phosphate isomerase